MALANCSSLSAVSYAQTTTITNKSKLSSTLFSSSSKDFQKFPSSLRIPPNQTVAVKQAAVNSVAEAFTEFKHLLLPITDRNPYLSEGTRQAAATTAALAKKYGADITVVVIDEKLKESLPEHDTQLSSIRWHLSEDY